MEESYAQALSLLRQGLNDSNASFYDGQWEAIDTLVTRRGRLLLVQRTGWGKSVVYFIATKLLRRKHSERGLSLLISPLLSLMRNQLEMAGRLGLRAATIHSGNTEEWSAVKAALANDNVDLLLVSPERLANVEFQSSILPSIASRVLLFIVDEAHCISDWGHDFRPDYRRITRVIQLLPRNVPLLATTATANDRVVEDVRGQLGSDVQVMRGSLARRTLQLQNVILPSQAERLAWLAQYLPQLPGSGIIYTLTVADAERVARWLQQRGLNVQAYHADLDNDMREALEKQLLNNEVKALVATVALGMGFDKPDLGFVVHFQRPASVVHYYQQIGRAGRGIDNAVIVLLGGEEDDEIADYFIRTAFPPQQYTDMVLNALRRAPNGLSRTELQQAINLSNTQIDKVLRLLGSESPSPILQTGSRYYLAPVSYSVDWQRVEKLTALRRAEQEEMRRYMQSETCLMEFLQKALNDPFAERCGRCAPCQGKLIVPAQISQSVVLEAVRFLRHTDLILKPRQRWPAKDGLPIAQGTTVIPPNLRAEEGRALSQWGDAGWGALVREGKYRTGRYSDELVDGVVQMVARWNPQPMPKWITCVPSLRHPELVPDFARRLADRLNLRFVPCVAKKKESRPQKEMQNSFHQVRNLEDVFEVRPFNGIEQPVFLVDDVVDSGWTLTIVAYLLRRSGSGLVFPVALAKQVLRGSE